MSDYDKALEVLFNKVKYLAEKGLINAKQLDTYKWMLKTFKQAGESNETQLMEAELNNARLLGRIKKLEAIIQMLGVSITGIEEMSALPERFLFQKLDRIKLHNRFLQKNIDFEALFHDFHTLKNLVETDRDAITEYKQIIRIKRQNPEINYQPIVDSYKKTYPHLVYFFAAIENNPEVKFIDLNKKLNEHYARN